MGRVYKRQIGARKYKNYSEEILRECLASIENHELTQRKASDKYGIPRRTIINQLKLLRTNQQCRPPGAPSTFTTEEEKCFVDCIIKLSEYGFPLTVFDLRIVVKSYLEKIGRKVNKFKDNCPGVEWVTSFLKRHSILSQRFAANIKRNRAAVDKDVITAYIQELKNEVNDVPPENIWNFDETNLSDDPGQKKIIAKRGMKYPEIIRNSSKSAISIMFCGNAAGELLPPYVVYKAKQLWNTWTENGPKNVRYNTSPSGWFDMNIFNDWFFSHMLPRLKKLDGSKVIIGDNLSSHISVDALKACNDHDIKFVCLPPNSTHLTQPLDVAFFGPMKMAWRNILSQWKSTEQGRRDTTIQKSSFPMLLNRLLEILAATQKVNLISGFRKCGIYPLDVQPLLDRLPKVSDSSAIQDSFIETLEAKRVDWAKGANIRKRRTKLNITPGKSVTGELDSIPNDKENEEVQLLLTSSKRNCRRINSDSSYVDSDHMSVHDSSSDLASLGDLKDNETETITVTEQPTEKSKFKPLVKAVGQYVVFKYEGELFPGVITKITAKGAYISSMTRSLKCWKWPTPKDEIHYQWKEIIGSLNPPKKNGRREIYSIPELNQIWGTNLRQK